MLSSVVLGLIFGVPEDPDGVAQILSGDDFSTIGDALDPSSLADARTVARWTATSCEPASWPVDRRRA